MSSCVALRMIEILGQISSKVPKEEMDSILNRYRESFLESCEDPTPSTSLFQPIPLFKDSQSKPSKKTTSLENIWTIPAKRMKTFLPISSIQSPGRS